MPAMNLHANTVELFARYPDVTENELERMVAAFPRLPALSVALMLSDEVLAPKLNRFCRDHRSRIRTPFHHYAVLIAIAVAGLVTTLWYVMIAG